MRFFFLSWFLFSHCLFAQNFPQLLHAKVHKERGGDTQQSLEQRAKPFLIRDDHRIKPILDRLFSERVTANRTTFDAAGFITISARPISHVIVARHPDVPGYIFKIYLDSEILMKDGKPGSEWLIQRCIGAKYIRDLIKKKNIKHFVVPSKRLYALPKDSSSEESIQQPYILIVKDMKIVTTPESIEAWKTKATPSVLKELFCFLSNGYGSPTFIVNIPYTKDGKFAFIDTEYPKRHFNLQSAKRYLSPEMCIYWDSLIEAQGAL